MDPFKQTPIPINPTPAEWDTWYNVERMRLEEVAELLNRQIEKQQQIICDLRLLVYDLLNR